MRSPQWLKLSLATVIIGSIGWAIQDRITIGERISTISEWVKGVDRRLDRIEVKLDKLLEKL